MSDSRIEFVRAGDVLSEDLTSLICEAHLKEYNLLELKRLKDQWKVHLTARRGDQAEDVLIDWAEFVEIFYKFLLFINREDQLYMDELRNSGEVSTDD